MGIRFCKWLNSVAISMQSDLVRLQRRIPIVLPLALLANINLMPFSLSKCISSAVGTFLMMGGALMRESAASRIDVM